MNKIIYLLLLFFLFLSPHIAFSEQDKQETEAEFKQRSVDQLTNKMNSAPYLLKAEWINSYTIEVQYHPDYFELITKNGIEDDLRDKSRSFYLLKDEPTCARGLDPDGNEVGYSCYGADRL